MYAKTSEEFNTRIVKSGRTFQARILLGDNVLEGLSNIKIESGSNNGESITIGSTVAQKIDIQMKKPEISFRENEFELQIGLVLDNETVEFVPMGLFTSDKIDIKSGNISFTAYDRMIKLERGYISGLSDTTDTISVLQEIEKQTGVPISTEGLSVIVIQKPVGYTCREVLMYIAQLYGRFANVNREGVIELHFWEESGYLLNPDRGIHDFSHGTDFTVSKIICATGQDEAGNTVSLSIGEGNGISISNPFMTQEILDEIYQNINGFFYESVECPVYLGDPRLDPWDFIDVMDTEGIVYKVPIMKLEHDYDGGLSSTVTSVVATESGDNTEYKGPMQLFEERMVSKIAIVEGLTAKKVSADELEAKVALLGYLKAEEADIRYLKVDSISAITLVVKEAAIAELSADFVTAETVEANYANITLSNVEKSTIGTLFADIGLITDATIVDGHVTGFLDAVEVNANSVTTGTLSVDRLVFRGSNKSIIYELNNITGALQAVQSETLNGEILTDRSITVDKIVAKSITANEIASATITANELAANCITADKIVSSAITSAKIATGAITAEKIASKTITADKINVNDLFAQDITATGTISGATLLGGSLQTSDENGTVIHDSYYSRYMYSDDERHLVVAPGGIGFYSVKVDGISKPCNAKFYSNDNECVSISEIGINLWNGSNNYQITNDGQAILNTLKINALSGSLGAFVVPVANGGTGATTVAGALSNIAATAGNITSPAYLLSLGSGGYQAGGGYSTLAQLKTAMALNNVDNTADSNKSVKYAGSAGYAPMLSFKGSNLITSTVNDTITNWGGMNTCVTFNSNTGQLTDQPSQYGLILNVSNGAQEVHQLWMTQSAGDLLHRGGNSNGWSGSWRRILDSSNYTSYCASASHTHSYLPLAGGTVSGATKIGNITLSGNTIMDTTSGITFKLSDADNGYYMSTSAFRPKEGDTGVPTLGTSGGKWKQLYASTSTISTSDRNVKDDIKPLKDMHKQFFMKLLPVSFTFKDGESGRTHIGFISQDVEQAMYDCGMTDLDFGGFCKDVKTTFQYSYEILLYNDGKAILDEDGNPLIEKIEKEVPLLDENGNKQYIYSLRYEEFIGLIAYVLQDTVNRLDIMNILQQNILSRMAILEAKFANMAA